MPSEETKQRIGTMSRKKTSVSADPLRNFINFLIVSLCLVLDESISLQTEEMAELVVKYRFGDSQAGLAQLGER